MKLKMEIELDYDDDLMHSCDEQFDDFWDMVQAGDIILHSNEIGDEIGKVKIIKIYR